MKKLFLIFLSYLYLLSVFGLTVQTHFCKKEVIKETNFFSNTISQSDPCAICVSKNKEQKVKKNGCCQHDTKVVKLKDNQHKVVKQELSFKFWNDAILHRFFGAVFEPAQVLIDDQIVRDLPDFFSVHETPLYIYHCVYLI